MSDAIQEFEDNVEATAAWDGPLFDIWHDYRELIEESLGPHGEAALALHPPPPVVAASTSAAASATPPSGWPSWSVPRGTRTGSTSRRG